MYDVQCSTLQLSVIPTSNRRKGLSKYVFPKNLLQLTEDISLAEELHECKLKFTSLCNLSIIMGNNMG
jgi:hypothetical protein